MSWLIWNVFSCGHQPPYSTTQVSQQSLKVALCTDRKESNCDNLVEWWEGAITTKVQEPAKRVKLGIHALNLPSFRGVVEVAGHQAVDTLNREEANSNISCPPEGGTSTGYGIDTQYSKSNRRLRTLTVFECDLVRKGNRAWLVSSKLIDTVGGIREVRGEKSFGKIISIAGQ